MLIGSVVKIKDIPKNIMIYGSNVLNLSNKKHYDYLGCFYPEGYQGDNYNVFFNKSDILEIIYKLKKI